MKEQKHLHFSKWWLVEEALNSGTEGIHCLRVLLFFLLAFSAFFARLFAPRTFSASPGVAKLCTTPGKIFLTKPQKARDSDYCSKGLKDSCAFFEPLGDVGTPNEHRTRRESYNGETQRNLPYLYWDGRSSAKFKTRRKNSVLSEEGLRERKRGGEYPFWRRFGVYFPFLGHCFSCLDRRLLQSWTRRKGVGVEYMWIIMNQRKARGNLPAS